MCGDELDWNIFVLPERIHFYRNNNVPQYDFNCIFFGIN
jgi:hypothetical protein